MMVKRRTLTQAKVLATANQLIESKGINGLTIRDLALVLDVRPQSIYNYVDSLSDLLDQVGLQFVQNVADRLTETISDVDGDEALMAFAQEFRAACNQSLPEDQLFYCVRCARHQKIFGLDWPHRREKRQRGPYKKRERRR